MCSLKGNATATGLAGSPDGNAQLMDVAVDRLTADSLSSSEYKRLREARNRTRVMLLVNTN